MSSNNKEDVVAHILAQEKNLQDIFIYLGDADDWLKLSQEQIDLGNLGFVSESNIKSSIQHFDEAEKCLSKALGFAEKVRNMEKISKEAEKASLQSTELINCITEKKYEVKNRRFLLENFDDAFNSSNWALISQYAAEAQEIWPEKGSFFKKVIDNAEIQMKKNQKVSLIRLVEKIFKKENSI